MADDWEKPTIIRKTRPTGKDARSNATINAAMANGNVEIHKKSSLFAIILDESI